MPKPIQTAKGIYVISLVLLIYYSVLAATVIAYKAGPYLIDWLVESPFFALFMLPALLGAGVMIILIIIGLLSKLTEPLSGGTIHQ